MELLGGRACGEKIRSSAASVAKVVLAVVSALAVSACSPNVLDFRNASISGGKVYSKEANEPFSGKLTNVPLGKLPATPIYKLTGLASKMAGNQELAGLLLAGAMAQLMGNGQGLLCDAKIRKGVVDGEVTCAVGDIPVLEFAFAEGAVDGKAVVYYPKDRGTRMAEATFKRGELDGPSKVLSPTGKTMHTVGWKAGEADGKEERYDAEGRVLLRANLVRGKYEGEATRYNPDGTVAEKSTYVNGVLQETPASSPPAADVEACIDRYSAAFSKEKGDDVFVKPDQVEEWRQACRSGKPAN